ncbi:MAG: hypothetical protein H7338_01040 [Candidatus Sericytochromatia bacterium]|nr:hypothetical protein [Candidatus Sericytochromatia bacterium]
MADATGPLHDADLRITGAETHDNSVSFEVLARVLDGMQQTVYLLAAAQDPRLAAKRRFQPSQQLRDTYRLSALVPQAGSFAVPIVIGTGQMDLPVLPSLHPEQMLATFQELLAAVSVDVWDRFYQLVPDGSFRTRLMRQMLAYFPKAGERWGFGFRAGGRDEVSLDARAARHVSTWLQAATVGDEAVMSIIGELQEIDFAANTLRVLYRPTGREIDCVYDPDIEGVMIENRRDNVQVTGRFVLDSQGNPEKLSEVTRIEAVDLSPMTIETVEAGGRMLRLTPPLTVLPSLDEDSGQLFVAMAPELGLDAFAYTRDELLDEIDAQLMLLWDEFAQEEPERLTSAAQALRLTLLHRIEEPIHHAT